MAYSPRLIDRFLERWRLASPNPAPHPAPRSALPPKAEPAAGMKAEKIFGAQSPIKTYGVEHDARIYGALPLRREEVQRGVQAARTEREEHEKQVTAPIQSYNNTPASAFSSQMGGLALLDSEFNRRTAQYENEQRALLASTGRSIDEIFPNARGRPPPPIKLGHAL